ncbi:hypothetical protein QBC33DRAFT_586704 [Phialemonium atrogriseum]|uniref:RBR-type E3 ubiquitin transferase n=1 Tax=Phialemonium atrogriseum TaxID=1093897 RepID=A0AAJ0C4B6_9PEZI|nr:uncharacterized protein QBC33DRAFT_586704 [Phialemonium atrogriseum]KAK1767421.1 hypothetical protein QBC33DRAFT_586704 [Phialemonium atrogriseum]
MSRLRRSISSVFRGKKAEPSASGSLGPLWEDAEDETVISTLAHEDALHDQQVQQAVIQSLRDRNMTLEQERNSQQNSQTAVLHLKEQLRVKSEELQSLQRSLANLQHDNAKVRQLEVTIENLGQMKKNLEERHAQRVAELQERLKEYQVLSVKMAETHAQVQERAKTLEAENLAILQSADRPIVEVQQEKIKLEKKTKALEAEIALGRSERREEKRAVAALQNRIVIAEDQNKELMESAALVNQELEVVKADSDSKLTRMAQRLEEQQQRHDIEREEASRGLGNELTPRIILVHKIFSQSFQAATVGDRANAASFLQSCSPAMLTNQLLDIRFDTQQARRFAESVAADGLTVLPCDLCQLPRFAPKPGAQPRLRVNEFARPSQRTSCCSKSICTKCYLDALTKSLVTDWWTHLGMENWMVCPTPSCNQPLPASHRGGLENLLRQLGDRDTENNMAMYDRILAFRAALSQLNPRPSDEALGIASALHTQLASLGPMHSLFEPAFRDTEPDETGRVPAFRPGKIWMISVDHGGGSIRVPLFVRFFRRQRTGKECTVCTDEIFDVEFGSVEEWLDLCAGFHGQWMWHILRFPAKLGLECSHEIDFCTGCLEKHIDSQLEQFGRSRCDQLACLSDRCGRRLSYDEVRLYAKPSTFKKYDRYLKLNALSQLPSFRWCLRPDCSSGQLYDDDGPPDPRIHCEECAFEMCYRHSMPWHEGQTCDQFDSVRQHGDPEFQQTRDWIAQNTKPCPNCKENIQKGEYCFHMTCSSCHFEFCWECLADWNLIAPRAGHHNQNAHGEGCYFRLNGLTPTQLSGVNLQEALRRR